MSVSRIDGRLRKRAARAAEEAVPSPDSRQTQAVILAGGRGARLAPYTSVLPKPLMPVGDVSILELVIRRLAACGINDITLSVGYLSHLIRAVLEGSGERDRRLSYVEESEPLGTAGPLRLIRRPLDSFLVMNGDVLTDLDFGDLVDHHHRSGSMLTIAAHRRTIKIDYGVLHYEDSDVGPLIRSFVEKPEIASTVSMGIYVMEPEVVDLIPQDQAFDFPDLVHRLLARGHQVGAFEFDGMWFDIGRSEDYAEAVTAWFAPSEASADEVAAMREVKESTGS